MSHRLAIVTTHPVQYYAPWFQFLAATRRLDLKVFYLWDGGTQARHDPGFGHKIRWDVPLLDGYEHEFVPNISSHAGSSHFFGLRNPTLRNRLAAFDPRAALLVGYNYPSFLRVIFARWPLPPPFPLIFRGDSHRLHARRSNLRETLRGTLISAIYRRFAAVLYVGHANRDYFRAYGVPDERLFFAPHAVDNARFSAHLEETRRDSLGWRRSLGIPDDRRLILFAGKFEEKKRPLDLLNAFLRLADRSHASLLFVGAGVLEPELRKVAKDEAHVHFAPFQNQTQMPRTYAAADLVVLPSYGRGETWGLAINEALCLGRPVIVSDHVGCWPDLVVPGKNGLVYPAGDVQALTDALCDALSDPARLVRWGEAGRNLVARYSYAQATKGLLSALDSLDGSRR